MTRARPRGRLLLLALGVVALGSESTPAPNHDCTLAWNATTTRIDGSPAPPGVRYQLWFEDGQGRGHGTVGVLGDTDGLALTLARCDVGSYWVVAYAAPDGSDASAPSTALVVTKGGPP